MILGHRAGALRLTAQWDLCSSYNSHWDWSFFSRLDTFDLLPSLDLRGWIDLLNFSF